MRDNPRLYDDTNGKTTSAAGLTASVVRDDQGNVGI